MRGAGWSEMGGKGLEEAPDRRARAASVWKNLSFNPLKDESGVGRDEPDDA